MGRPSLLVLATRDLFASFFSPAHQRRLRQLFDWRRSDARVITPQLRRLLQTVQALVTTWDSPVLADDLPTLAPKLRMIAHCGGEVKGRFARPLFERLTITNSADPMARATAELGAAFLLYSARNLDFYRAELRKRSNRIYEDLHTCGTTQTLIGQEVAMIGFGRIGRALVDLLRGFDLRWWVYDPYAPRALQDQYPVRFAGLATVLKHAQLLILCAALTDETRGILSRQNLAKLPDNAAVINIARGGLVDLEALTNEVRRGRLRCALDVTDPSEPLPVGDPLRRLPGAIVTPHMGGGTVNVRRQMAEVVIDDLERFFRGQAVRNRVTTAMLDRMT